MNKNRGEVFFKLALITIILTLGFANPSLANGTIGKSGSINLTLPGENQGNNLIKPGEEQDLFNEKYDEVLNEISISEEAVFVVEQIKNVVLDVETVEMNIVINEIKGQHNEEVLVKLAASVNEQVGRIEFLAPSALRGHIVVANQKKMETKMFRPVVNQITVQTLEDISKEALSAMSVADLTSYFDFTQYDVAILETKEIEDVTDYLIHVLADDNEEWQVRVQSDSWIPYEITVLEHGVVIGKMTFSELTLNSELTLEELTLLPKVKEVRM